MQVNSKSKNNVLKTLIITMIIFFGMIPFTTSATETTTVSIDPISKTVSQGETFTVDVLCEPAQPMKSFEFKLSFDPSLLQVNSVTEGNIFNDYNTFVSTGTIDNTEGTVVDIYSLIVGSGNVTNSGTLVTISFTALDSAGTSTLDLYDTGVTDEAGYLSITVNDGSITIQGSDDDPDPPTGGGGGSSGGGGGYVPPAEDDDEQNHPPETPSKPSGPTFVEMGVEYTYSSSTYDTDGDQIRYKFDWGDDTYSDWSEFTVSNISVSMSHSCSYILTYEVKVIAQDENGTNSSWSLPLDVTVTQVDSEDEEPVIEVEVTNNESTNQTIVFDVSGSYDPDGAIVSYHWDFGDGTTGGGKNPTHEYENPGTYTVILTITDNNGNKYNKTMTVTVGSEATNQSEEKQNGIPFYIIGIIGFLIAILVCFTIFFRDSVTAFLSQHKSRQFSEKKVSYRNDKIEKLDEKIHEIKQMNEERINFEQPNSKNVDSFK